MSILPLSGIKGEGTQEGQNLTFQAAAQLSLARMPAWLLVFAAVSKTFGSPSPPGRGESRWSCPIYPLEALSPIKPRTALCLGTAPPQNDFQHLCHFPEHHQLSSP